MSATAADALFGAAGLVAGGGVDWARTLVSDPSKAPASARTPTTAPTDAAPATKERSRLMQVIGALVRQVRLKDFINSYGLRQRCRVMIGA